MRNWLITIRKEKGYPQKYVAELIGVAPPSYCNIEKGKTSPAVSTAKKIGAVLGFDWTRFYDDDKSQDSA
ncbi:MAG: helix-turn-helix transcriptional regulator [Clostridiales bacterium]|nr:helix-turn-helix transcriptional regulator [Clostridiales bacterium]